MSVHISYDASTKTLRFVIGIRGDRSAEHPHVQNEARRLKENIDRLGHTIEEEISVSGSGFFKAAYSTPLSHVIRIDNFSSIEDVKRVVDGFTPSSTFWVNDMEYGFDDTTLPDLTTEFSSRSAVPVR